MKNKLILVLFLQLVILRFNAQVKIGNNPNTINVNSLLELESSNKGFLAPRVALNNINTVAPLTGTVPEGMLIYSSGGSVSNGFYYWNGTKWLCIVPSATGAMGSQPYAEVSSSINQFVTSTSTSALITLEVNEGLNLISHSTTTNTSRLIIQEAGEYLITISAQLGGGAANIDIWTRKNGVDVPNSNSRSSLQNSNDCRMLTVVCGVSAIANDYFEIVLSSTNISAGLITFGTQTNPTRPSIPSVIITLSKISD